MSENMIFDYDKESGTARCLIKYNGIYCDGEAHCHPDDMDFESERVGMTIAEIRAHIKVLTFIRDHEIKPQLQILKHLYSNIKTSKHYNPKSHESVMIRSQIRSLEKELTAINYDIADERKYLKDYISGKDKLYNKLRAKSQ